MIHDYYLSNMCIEKNFVEWDKTKEDAIKNKYKKQQWKNKSNEEKNKLWLDEIFNEHLVHLAKKKKEILNKLKEGKDYTEFYPNSEDLKYLPKNSVLIKISFILKKPYTSKDEGEFHLLEGEEKDQKKQKISENPIVRDKFTGRPIVRPTTWKGHLRFAAQRVDWEKPDEKEKIIKNLFGSESKENETLKGKLYFFPTFFEGEAKRDVITPLSRKTRTPTNGPISLEVMKPNSKGDFHLLYIPYSKSKNSKEEQINVDLEFLAETLRLMFYIYGFSAKKTSGFGVIEEKLGEGKICRNLDSGVNEKEFSELDELKKYIKLIFSE